ncbi:hypothetical protein CEB3_c20850 [Peptococcaceae bacterium CEB3]|nr:hypothetical protein CEB3_c20850 [Peptococcaceae bacterium CEB3]
MEDYAIMHLADRSLLPEKRQTQNVRTETRDFDEYSDAPLVNGRGLCAGAKVTWPWKSRGNEGKP